MKVFSKDGKVLPVGKSFVVFTDLPDLVGAEIQVVDTHGKRLNIARITHVAVSSNANTQKYAVKARVTEETDTQTNGVFMARLYSN